MDLAFSFLKKMSSKSIRSETPYTINIEALCFLPSFEKFTPFDTASEKASYLTAYVI